MHRLGTSTSKSSDWDKSPAYYLRLTISPHARLQRPVNHYPTQNPGKNRDPCVVRRDELLDLGHCDTYDALCELIT